MSTALLLAAGRARRFGSHKLLHPLPDGRPLALAAASTLRAAGLDCVAVLRADDRPLADLMREAGVACTVNPAPDEGMAGSIVAGVRARPDAAWWLIALADMPWLREDTLRRLGAVMDGGAGIAAPVHQGRRGHPVGFSATLRDELLALHGEHGARGILQGFAERVVSVPVDDPGIHRDVDHPSDLVPSVARETHPR